MLFQLFFIILLIHILYLINNIIICNNNSNDDELLKRFKNSNRNKGAGIAIVNYPSINDIDSKPKEYKMFIHNISECVWMSKHLLYNHEWEPILIASLIKSLNNYNNDKKLNTNNNVLFIDIGANIGTFSFTIASLNYNVISIEPLFYNTELYLETQKINNFNNCKLFKIALTDIDKNESLCFIPFESTKKNGNLGNGRVESMENCIKNENNIINESEIVKSTTLDNILNNNEMITAMKIDIEGHEYAALIGGLTMLKSDRAPCHIQFEYVHLRKSEDRNQLIHLLHNLNYQCQLLSRYQWINIYEKVDIDYSKGEYRCFHKKLDRCKSILLAHHIDIINNNL